MYEQLADLIPNRRTEPQKHKSGKVRPAAYLAVPKRTSPQPNNNQ